MDGKGWGKCSKIYSWGPLTIEYQRVGVARGSEFFI